jgi:hypothetical protein
LPHGEQVRQTRAAAGSVEGRDCLYDSLRHGRRTRLPVPHLYVFPDEAACKHRRGCHGCVSAFRRLCHVGQPWAG